MIAIVLFGLGLMVLSASMALRPVAFARGIVAFSEKPWFHPFEIGSRLVFGILLVLYAGTSACVTLVQTIGFVLIAVGIGLALTPPARHRQYARWSARTFERAFRPSGLIGLVFGGWIVWCGVGGPAL